METKQYLTAKKKLNLHPAWLPTVFIFLVDICLLAVVFGLVRSNSNAGYVVAVFLLAIVAFHSFGVHHECGHGNVSRNKLFNTILGHLVSPLCLLPYYPWKYIHMEHHRWTGNIDKDPTLKALKKRKEIGRFSLFHQLIWQSWIPIAGMVQYTVFWAYPLTLLGRKDVKRRILVECTLSVCWLLAFWTLLLFTVPATITIYVILPSVIFYFVLVELINLPHHSDQPVFSSDAANSRLALQDQHRTSRSCYYPRWISELLFLNFNFHIEHHLFPNLPWHRLREARDVLKDLLDDKYTESIGFSWNIDNRQEKLDRVFLAPRTLKSDANGDPKQTNRPTDQQTNRHYRLYTNWQRWQHRNCSSPLVTNTWFRQLSHQGKTTLQMRASHLPDPATHSGSLAA